MTLTNFASAAVAVFIFAQPVEGLKLNFIQETPFMALSEVSNDPHCRHGQDRVKAGPDDFYTVLDQTTPYTDMKFTEEHALYWADQS